MTPKDAKREDDGPSLAGDYTKPLLKRPPADCTGMHQAAGIVVDDPTLHAASPSSSDGVHHPTEVDQLTRTYSGNDAHQQTEIDRLMEAFRALSIHDSTYDTGYNEAGYDADADKKPWKRRRKRVRHLRRRRKAQKTSVPSLDHEEVTTKDEELRHLSPD